MVERPIGIHVRYVNEEGEDKEQKLYDYHARVFLHEMDHLEGRTMTHWSLSEGNVDILSGFKRENENLLTTVEFYKDKIDQLKRTYHNIFDDFRKFEFIEEEGVSEELKQWKKFEQPKKPYKDGVIDHDSTNSSRFPSHLEPPTIQEPMIIDTIRAMRKDKKMSSRRN